MAWAEDLAVALGAEEDMAWLPGWMENLVLDLGRAGLAAAAAEAANALIRIDPDNESTYAADLGCALAEAGDDRATRAQVEANLARWPEQPWVRVHAGDALQELGDADGAESHFLAALEMAEQADDFELRSDVFDRLAELGRPAAPTTTIRLVGTGGRSRRSRTARLGRNDLCFCGSAASTSTATASRPDTRLHKPPNSVGGVATAGTARNIGQSTGIAGSTRSGLALAYGYAKFDGGGTDGWTRLSAQGDDCRHQTAGVAAGAGVRVRFLARPA